MFEYTVDKKPLKVTIDPESRLVDLDFRNNTTKMSNKVIFDWPGLDYNPRNEYLYRWSPQFFYWDATSDFAPGFRN